MVCGAWYPTDESVGYFRSTLRDFGRFMGLMGNGLMGWCGQNPPMNRWAIFGSSLRDFKDSGLMGKGLMGCCVGLGIPPDESVGYFRVTTLRDSGPFKGLLGWWAKWMIGWCVGW
ncbi:MAG: hypothetical protein R3B96_15570 [Pirellulaceae bacterium]